MEKKSIKKNYIYNLIYQILIIILPLITTPYISRVLGADGVGIYGYTLSIATYFVLFGSLGIAMYGQREIAYCRDDLDKRSKNFWEIFILRLFTMSISIIAFIIIFLNRNDYSIYYRILILELIANVLDISFFFQGLEEFKKTVTRNLILKIVSVICIFIFIKQSSDLWLYILIYTLSNVFGNLSLWIYLPEYIRKVKIKELEIKKHLKPTITLFIPQVAMQIYLVLDKTMLGKFLGDMTEVGNYEQSQKIVKLTLSIITALGTVVAPRIANIISNGEKEKISEYLENSFTFVWFLGLPIMFGLMAISTSLTTWFLGVGYEESSILIKIGSLLILAIGLNNVTGIQYLIPAKKQNEYTKSVIIAAIINFALNCILIHKFKAVGAIVASVIAEFSIVFIQLYDVRKDFDLKIVVKNSYKFIISSIIMFIPTFIIGYKLAPTVKTTIIQISVGIIIYFIVLIILKEKYVYQFLDKISKKLNKQGE